MSAGGGEGSKYSLTVTKIDAGMAILLTSNNQLIEFPSYLLPPGVQPGSVINLQLSRNISQEEQQRQALREVQEHILKEFGTSLPKPPVLRVRNVTQTSAVLEWDPLDIAKSDFRGLRLYKDNQLMVHSLPINISTANTLRETKVTGLDVDHEYTFRLEQRTSASRSLSEPVQVRTHTLDNLTGIRVCFGDFESAEEVADLKECIERIGAKWTNHVSIDVTHLLCRTPSGPNYEIATALSIPVVRPDWLLACEANRKLQPALSYYTNSGN
ncbi:hypothetical protein H4219_004858 [Mycoemilia scoparia]|uniref:Uncharacterized protein n=1 Tax=Mycoemilia scoparia TaxID=417184 RepID=A0A9W8DR65_9FUNG|nr:hypothetical protein H4219_004858 [Mycoemilia scoparia]